MDEILQRMLEIERRAEAIRRTAGQEVATILERGRSEAAALEERLQRELVAEAEALVDDAVAAAEQGKCEALCASDTELAARVAALRARIAGSPETLIRALAHPLRDPAHG